MSIKEKGISLIELMIVVAVIGIIAVVAIPQYRQFLAISESVGCLDFISPARLTADAIILANNGSAASIGGDVTALELVASPAECDGGVTVNGAANGAVIISGSVTTNLGSNTMTYTRTAATGVWQCSSSNSGFALETCP